MSGDVLVQESPAPVEWARGFGAVIDIVDHRAPELLASSRQRYKSWREDGYDPDYRRGMP